MKSYDGYLKRKLGDSYVNLTNGGHKSLGDFLGSILWDSTNKKIQYKASNASSWSDLLSFGDRAFDSTSYLPLSGGTITSSNLCPLFINATNNSLSCLVLSLNGIMKAQFGYTPSEGAYIWNYDNSKQLRVGTTIYTNASGYAVASGVSTQFLKADGTLDSTAYLPTSGGTMTGDITMNDEVAIQWSPNFTGYMRTPFRIKDGSYFTGINLYNSGGNTYTKLGIFTDKYGNGNDSNCIFLYPNATPKIGTNTIWHSGNFNPGDYLPLTGGTMTLPSEANFLINHPNGTGLNINTTSSTSDKRSVMCFLTNGSYHTQVGAIVAGSWIYNYSSLNYILINSSASDGVTCSTTIHASGFKNTSHAQLNSDVCLFRSGNGSYVRILPEGIGICDPDVNGTFVITSETNICRLYHNLGRNISFQTISATGTYGNVGIGTDSPTAKLHVNCGYSDGIFVNATYQGYTIITINGTMKAQYGYATGQMIMHSYAAGGGITIYDSQYILSAFNFYAPNFYTSSDARKKKNIHNISDNIKQFEWKETGETSYGFVAQDLEKKHPELVSDGGDTKTVNYNAAICLLLSKLENRLERIERELNIERREEDEII